MTKRNCEPPFLVSFSLGSPPEWNEHHNTEYILRSSNCEIRLKSFSWEKLEVGDEIVDGKNILIYAAKNIPHSETRLHIDIGYYLNLPGWKNEVRYIILFCIVKVKCY